MAEKQIFGPLALPSGKKIKFRAPLGVDRANVLQMMKMSSDNLLSSAFLIDAYVAAKCVTEIDGQATDANYKRTYDAMEDEDANYFLAVWQELFGMNDEKRQKAKEDADFLRKNLTCTAGCK